MHLAKTIQIEHVGPQPMDTKINIFQLPNGLWQGHVLRKPQGAKDFTLQHPTKECPDEYVAEEQARAWHRRNPRHFEDNPILDDFLKGVKV